MIHVATEDLKAFFAPIALIISLKVQDELAFHKALDDYREWVIGDDGSHDSAVRANKAESLLENAMWKFRAFEKEATDAATGRLDYALQKRFHNAADYQDEWYRTYVPKSNHTDSFRTWYVCDAGGGTYVCQCIILAKHWDRLHADELANSQRWYCGSCSARYNQKFGLIIEMTIAGVPHYCRANFPPQGTSDIKWMSVGLQMARDGNKFRTPEELYAQIPDAVPLGDGKSLEKVTKSSYKPFKEIEGHYRFRGLTIDELPLFDFLKLFNFTEEAIQCLPKSVIKRLGVDAQGSAAKTSQY
jgi:hypothetical protein